MLLCASGLAVAASEAGAAIAPRAEARQDLRTQIKTQLGADRVKVKCTRSGLRCRWQAKRGVDGWPYRCGGRAVRRHNGSWRITRCNWRAPKKAPLASQAHPILFGFNDGWQSFPNKVSYAAVAGAEVVRFPFSWNLIEPNRGQRDWTVYDNLYKEALSKGIKLILTPADSPCWARPSLPCEAPPYAGWRPDQEFLGEFSDFVSAAVRRYPQAVALEVWNEPNLHPYFDPAPNTTEYTRILRAGYLGSKAARPGLPVLFGGLAGVEANQPGKMINYLKFLRQVNNLGGTPYYDAVSFHFYQGLELGREMMAKIKGELMRAGVPGRDLWLTETGYSVNHLGSQDSQAAALEKTYDSLSRIPDVRSMLIHNMFDKGGWSFSADMGLIDTLGEPKLSFEMFAAKLG